MLLAAPGFAQKVIIDYAHGFDFSTIRTFQYVETEESNIQDNPMMADRVVALIKKELVEGGKREVQSGPDLYVTDHFTSQERKSYSTTHTGMDGYGSYWDDWGGWGGGGMSSSTTREYSYEEGTLIIAAYDAQEKKMVWRGSGTVTVKSKPDKQVKQVKQVDKILRKLGARWDKILHGKGK
jgi:hypothetical protein